MVEVLQYICAGFRIISITFINKPLITRTKSLLHKKMKCRICKNNNLKKFLSLGKTPLANSFLSKKELNQKEKSFPLEICFCNNCKLVQLTHVVPGELMFKNYVYVSSTTNTFKQHFNKMAEDISNTFNLSKNSLVVDIGSNDGLLLRAFQKFGARTIGIEPATNVARIAEQNGVETINDFFSENSVKKIISRRGNAGIITAANVFAHVNNLDEFIGNVKKLLKKDGIFVIEVQYFADTIEKMTFDNIYHEHLSYFTLTPLIYFFKRHGMEVFNAQRVASHGGSLRVFIKNAGSKYEIDGAVKEALVYENKLGINDFELYKQFADKVYIAREKLVSLLKRIKREGKSIAGYGAPAKGNTLLNFCKIGTDYIGYIVDDNPLKIGLYTPGMHISVVSSEVLDEKKPDYILILAWNFAEEILSKTKKYSDAGVKFIIPLPEPVVI